MSRGEKLNIFIGTTIDIKKENEEESRSALREKSNVPLYFLKEKRRGKTVTLVGPFSLSKKESIELLKGLKKKLGCGAVYRDDFMEFQGDLKERLRELLVKQNFCFRKGH